MTRPPAKTVPAWRTRTALEHARRGETVIIIVDRAEHAGEIMTELDLHKRAPGEILTGRRTGRQGLDHTRTGGSIRFHVAGGTGLRGYAGVDLFLVDPRVATSTQLEEDMALACRDVTGTIVRPGDQLTVGQIAGVR